MNNYEKLIEFIINEDTENASALFHKIVVEKSREIYESIMDEEEFGGSKVDGMMHDINADEQGMHEDDELGDGDEFAADGGDEFGGMGDDDMGGEEGGMGDEFGDEEGEGSVEDRVVDLEDALDSLRAEFDRLMAGEEGHGEEGDMGGDDMGDMGDDDMGGDDMGDEENDFGNDEHPMGESEESDDEDEDNLEEDFEFMREYVEKVTLPANKAEGHEVGAKGTSVNVNKKETVAGKNDMGGTTANIVKGFAEKAPDGTTPKSNAKKPTDMKDAGKFANVPGGNAGKDWWKKAKTPGNTEGKQSGNGGSVSVNKTSDISGKGLNGNKSGKK